MKPWYGEMLKNDTDPALRKAVAQSLKDQRGPETADRVGCLVEFVLGRKCRLGAVRAERGRQLRVYDLEGRSRRIGQGQVVDCSSQRLPLRQEDELRRALRRVDRRRQALAGGVDLETVWEVAVEAGEKVWEVAALVDLYFSAAPDDDARAALVRRLLDGSYFNWSSDGLVALAPEAVSRRRRLAAERQRQNALRLAQARWVRAVADGREASPPQDAAAVLVLLEEVALAEADTALSAAAVQLMQQAHLHGPQAAFEVLVRLGHWQADENLDLRRLGWTEGYGPLQGTVGAPWPAVAKARRARRRGAYGWAADGGGCERVFRLRRGLWGYRLDIYCAVPGLLTGPEDAVQAAALERGVSLELPDRRLGLLPPGLEEQARFGTERWAPALCLQVRFNRRWEVRSCDFALRQVRPAAVFGLEAALPPEAAGLQELALRLRRRRQAAGALMMPPAPEVAVKDGQVGLRRLDGDAQILCQELEYLAARLAAAWCRRRGVAAVYSTQALAGQAPAPGPWDAARIHEQIKSLERPLWQTRPTAHPLLGLEGYVSWCRPLDSYLDLFMQQQLAAVCLDKAPMYTEDALAAAVAATAWSREAAHQVKRRARRYWALKGLEGRVGQTLTATVVERLGAASLVQLDALPLKAAVDAARLQGGGLGDRMLVRIEQAAARRDVLRLAPAAAEGA